MTNLEELKMSKKKLEENSSISIGEQIYQTYLKALKHYGFKDEDVLAYKVTDNRCMIMTINGGVFNYAIHQE